MAEDTGSNDAILGALANPGVVFPAIHAEPHFLPDFHERFKSRSAGAAGSASSRIFFGALTMRRVFCGSIAASNFFKTGCVICAVYTHIGGARRGLPSFDPFLLLSWATFLEIDDEFRVVPQWRPA
jgi:hypothetical protein